MKAPRWLRHPGLTFNHYTYCVFWGCEPKKDGTWWRAKNDLLVLTTDTVPLCSHCGEVIPLDQAR